MLIKTTTLTCFLLATALSMGYLDSAVAAANGSSLYNNHCSRCHGNDGSGGFMPGLPNFSRGEGLRSNNRSLIDRIQRGNNACPSFRGIMSEIETLSLINHLRTLY